MVGLTGVAADGEARVRAQAFACAHAQRAVLYDSLQLNAIRYAETIGGTAKSTLDRRNSHEF
jgi:hypothetical protein